MALVMFKMVMMCVEILRAIASALTELFRLDAALVHESSRFRDDLDLDSVDAVDLAARLEELTGKRFDESRFKSIATIGDIVDIVEDALSAKEHT